MEWTRHDHKRLPPTKAISLDEDRLGKEMFHRQTHKFGACVAHSKATCAQQQWLCCSQRSLL